MARKVHEKWVTFWVIYNELTTFRMPGWYFVDWDFADKKTCLDWNDKYEHSICNIWYYQICDILGLKDLQIDVKHFHQVFWKETGFSLSSSVTDNPSIHATAVALSCPSLLSSSILGLFVFSILILSRKMYFVFEKKHGEWTSGRKSDCLFWVLYC